MIDKRARLFSISELTIILMLACVPLFVQFPYRVNIFLSWEGAYRMSQGEIPYKDFGLPLGYMYWVIPALFFKIFGVKMITLVKAQVFINILSGLAFRSILKSLSVQPGIRLLSVFLYCISFSFFNFWPWYNHTVIVYEMIGLAFLMHYFFSTKKTRWIQLVLSALFIFFSFFTKQDGGALAILLSMALLLYYSIRIKDWKPIVIFGASFLLIAVAIIYPLTKYSFSYWFNHGQPPHTARFSVREILDDFFYGSQFIKFYLLIIALLVIALYKKWKDAFNDTRTMLFLLLTTGILAEAAIIQVTSYTPPDNNIFFHSFAFAFIFSYLSGFLKLDFSKYKNLAVFGFGLILWWSASYWKYFQRIIERVSPPSASVTQAGGENIVNRATYMIHTDSAEIPMSEWKFSSLPSFKDIYMPAPTVEGIDRLMKMDMVKSNKNLNVLNMSELTPLAAEIPFKLEKGQGYPLWYHLGVGMFNKQAEMFEQKIKANHYDLVLFEYIPSLNNFYPFRVRDTLLNNYYKIDSFPAPRRGDTRGMIEVFVKPTDSVGIKNIQ